MKNPSTEKVKCISLRLSHFLAVLQVFTSNTHTKWEDATEKLRALTLLEKRDEDWCSQRYKPVEAGDLSTEAGCGAIVSLKDTEEKGALVHIRLRQRLICFWSHFRLQKPTSPLCAPEPAFLFHTLRDGNGTVARRDR